MINSIKINQVLYNQLKNITALGGRLYPIIAENGADYPFLIYKRDSITSQICKDGLYEDLVSFTIKVVTKSYAEGIEIAQNVRTILQREKIIGDDMTLYDVRLTNMTESYEYDAYIQNLNFNTKIS